MTTFTKDELNKIKEYEKNSNHYCIVTATCLLGTDTSVFVFPEGNRWSEDDMYDYIKVIYNNQPYALDIKDIKYRVSHSECYLLSKSMKEDEGKNVSWMSANKDSYYEYLKDAELELEYAANE